MFETFFGAPTGALNRPHEKYLFRGMSCIVTKTLCPFGVIASELDILIIETSHIRRKSQIDHFLIFRTPSDPFYGAKNHQNFSEPSSTYELKDMIQ